MNTKEYSLKTFPQGGLHLPDRKLSARQPIEKIALPSIVYLAISQHVGKPAIPIVNVNDKVKVGQLIAKAEGLISANIHSSVSGTVLKIEKFMDTTGYKREAIIIKVEGDDWLDDIDLSGAVKRDISASPQEIIDRVRECGIVGLGGATFPSHVKLMVPKGKRAEFLLINGAECEPFLTSDHRMMLERGEEILIGVKILLKALGISKAFIGIENNKSDAITHLNDLSKDEEAIDIIPLKVQYPQGGERQLVKAIINKEIPPPPKGLPIDVGCVVFNVSTTYAVYEAVQKKKPLVERVVTVTGPSIKKPSNFLVRLGTLVSHLMGAAGGLPEDTGKVVNGGPMMGKALNTIDIPVTKGMSGLSVYPSQESKRGRVFNCIRCGKCVFMCPLGLEPYLLMTLAEKKMWDRAEQEKILSCCECACCTYICPANRPLLDHIRVGKRTVLDLIKSRKK